MSEPALRARRLLLLDRTDPDQPMWLCAWVTTMSQAPALLDHMGEPVPEAWHHADALMRHAFRVVPGVRVEPVPAQPPVLVWDVREYTEREQPPL